MRALVFASALLVACTQSHPRPEAPFEPRDLVEPDDENVVSIGPEGGVLRIDDLTLTVPPRALLEDVEIRVRGLAETPPEGFEAYSAVVEFAPLGLAFETLARIAMPFDGDPDLATIFWTNEEGAFVALSTTVVDRLALAEVTQLGRAFVGTGCGGGSCCRRATGELDLLMVVDNSNSMEQEQASLVAQFPRMARVLATGDLDGDGDQDFPAARSIQLGVVSTDMGTGGFSVNTCTDSAFGDDGILLSRGNDTIPGCAADYEPIARYSGGDSAAFVEQVGCVASLGTGGCGFEQQLEASLKALTPSGSALGFHQSTRGHGDAANAGLIRDDSVLTILQITDEDDCSAADPELFNESTAIYTGNLNLRCFSYPAAVHPTSRYVDGFLALRADPGRLVFSAIAGIPVHLGGQAADSILRDPLMVETVDPEMPNRLRPSCNVPGRGLAFPPTRLVEVARDLEAAGATSTVHSICQPDFAPAMNAILARVADGLSGACVP